jgi:outer membrane protein TolC
MRVKPQFLARFRNLFVAGSVVALFASARPVSVSGQTNPPPVQTQQAAQTSATGPVLEFTSADAVRMALENNLGIQASRLAPEVQALAVAQTRSAYAPTLFSNTTTNSNSNPPDNFLTGNANFFVSEGVRSNAGMAQLIKWGGGRYDVSLGGGRNTTNNPSDPFSPRLSSNFNLSVTQPLLRDFGIDQVRQQLLVGQKQQEIVDVQLRQQITQTSRRVQSAYFDLVGAMGQLNVARQTLELAQQSLKDNQTRVEVGTLPPIDIIEAQAEVSRNEEGVIVAEARIKTFEDALRTLIMNPTQPDFWSTRLVPTEQPVVTPQPIDVEGAIANALANRTDLTQARKEVEQTDIGLRFARNQRLPAVNALFNYGLAGLGGTRTEYDYSQGFPIPTGTSQRSFSDALRDVFGNEFKTWSLQLQVSYPLGTSTADAALAQGRVQRQQEMTTLRQLEMQVATGVREAARQVETSLKRVEATTKAREFAERRLEAEQKRMTVGLSTTFQLFQAQREVSQQRLSELTATIDYNRALINFQAVQSVPLQ